MSTIFHIQRNYYYWLYYYPDGIIV